MTELRRPKSKFRVRAFPDGSLRISKKGSRSSLGVPADEVEVLIGLLEDAADPHKPKEEAPKTPLHQKKPEPGCYPSWRLQCYRREDRRRYSQGVYYFGTEQAVEVFRRTLPPEVTESVLSRRGPWKTSYSTLDVRLHNQEN